MDEQFATEDGVLKRMRKWYYLFILAPGHEGLPNGAVVNFTFD
jgi:hypothetical protein